MLYHMMIKWSKGISDACLQFDVYLSDPHYTEKVAICCGDDKLNYSLYSFTESNHLLI